MWIVILNFCLFLLLIGFMFYGFSKWGGLITEYNDGSDTKSAYEKSKEENLTDSRYFRFPIWLLLIGILIYQLADIII